VRRQSRDRSEFSINSHFGVALGLTVALGLLVVAAGGFAVGVSGFAVDKDLT